jgi:hypothetical protein
MCINISYGNSQYINTILHPKYCVHAIVLLREMLSMCYIQDTTPWIYSYIHQCQNFQGIRVACLLAFQPSRAKVNQTYYLLSTYKQNLFFARYVSEVPSVNLVGGDGVHPRTKCKTLPSGWCVGGHWFTRAHFRLQSRV